MSDKNLFILLIVILSIVLSLASSLISFLIFRGKKNKNNNLDNGLNNNLDFLSIKNNLENKLKSIEEKLNDAKNAISNNERESIKTLEKINITSNSSEKSIKELVEKFIKVDSETSKIENIIKSIQQIDDYFVNNHRGRGQFGEFILEQILEDVFGSSGESNIWQRQYQYKNENLKADIMLKLGEDRGNIVIDSKFPLTCYQEYIDDPTNKNKIYTFKKSIFKCIDDVSKYLSEDENVKCIFIFIPSESIYSSIIHEFSDELFKKINDKKNVLIVSPTTLLISIKVLKEFIVRENSFKNYDLICKNLKDVRSSLEKLNNDYQKYKNNFLNVYKSWESLDRRFDSIINKIDKIIKNDDN